MDGDIIVDGRERPGVRMSKADRVLNVWADWDAEARVWVAASDDVPGLVAEAASLDELFCELQTLIPELLALNGMKHGEPAAFQLVAASEKARIGAA
jgi:predicted RNase H-like HicB family nuclease